MARQLPAPLDTFFTVKEVHLKCVLRNADTFRVDRHQILIAPNPHAGRDGRYSVIHIQVETGQATMLGREIPLSDARQITSDFLVSLGENVDGSLAYCCGFAGERRLYERGN